MTNYDPSLSDVKHGEALLNLLQCGRTGIGKHKVHVGAHKTSILCTSISGKCIK
jgi:hypothetical protein